ncbi:MAG: LysR family transcriptional regulator [Chloroflexi bacterium]|nr:LysR family transcriptional regulator [Chloroflexota bacterium]
MLDLRKLQIFISVVQAGSFSGAAERLLMTQSGVSQHIQDLERGFSTILFERRARGVTLTNAGHLLLGYAEQLLQIAHEAELALTTVTPTTRAAMRLGATPGVGTYVLPTCLTGFQARYPQVHIDLTTRTTPQIVEAVLSGVCDLGIIEGEPDTHDPAVRIRRLVSVSQWLVIGPQHEWWNRESVALAELSQTALITRQRGSHSRQWLERELASLGLSVRIAAEFDNVGVDQAGGGRGQGGSDPAALRLRAGSGVRASAPCTDHRRRSAPPPQRDLVERVATGAGRQCVSVERHPDAGASARVTVSRDCL